MCRGPARRVKIRTPGTQAPTALPMNECHRWNLLHHRPWDAPPRLGGARTDELFGLMACTSLGDAAVRIAIADGCVAATAMGPSPVLLRDAGRYQCAKLHPPVLA